MRMKGGERDGIGPYKAQHQSHLLAAQTRMMPSGNVATTGRWLLQVAREHSRQPIDNERVRFGVKFVLFMPGGGYSFKRQGQVALRTSRRSGGQILSRPVERACWAAGEHARFARRWYVARRAVDLALWGYGDVVAHGRIAVGLLSCTEISTMCKSALG